MAFDWIAKDMVDVSGKRILITGGNSGIGFETARAFASKGADVILGVRNITRGEAAVHKLKLESPKSLVGLMQVDLSDLSSIRKFAADFCANYSSLDILINNAGIMMPPLSKTRDGFEAQFGGNHLGHFALTGLLFNLLKNTPDSRVVTVSSLSAHNASIDFENLDGSKGYKRYQFYGQSKLANMLFGKELQARIESNGLGVKSIVCHPGVTHTNLASRNSGRDMNLLFQLISRAITQPTEMGALPILYAATEDSLQGGEYIGPDGKKKRKGYPVKDPVIDRLYDAKTASRLWALSEEMTGVNYFFSKGSSK
ncbi:short-chain dehydrogenase [Neobacillus piezotolerans]|uniref:Short-chain dehydrogenase n=1 Tax=Neobacillus piezotolerans TaxID=2259171 RepID=A0A3D8GMP4_9BACI|nr:oxidoreductase [Neobacillus piezotolerans]RDU35764.1 short-chain dehydrogenase [Neobacillus piezotolerans]